MANNVYCFAQNRFLDFLRLGVSGKFLHIKVGYLNFLLVFYLFLYAYDSNLFNAYSNKLPIKKLKENFLCTTIYKYKKRNKNTNVLF